MSTHDNAPHYVYRCFNSDGQLIYVGSTYNPPRRMEQHAAKSHWWPEVASIRNTIYPNLDAALARERRAIFEESPIHNVKGADAKLLRQTPRGERKSPLNQSPEAVRWLVRDSEQTQRAIAKEVGISPGQLSEICKGTRNANRRVMRSLARALDCPVCILEASVVAA